MIKIITTPAQKSPCKPQFPCLYSGARSLFASGWWPGLKCHSPWEASGLFSAPETSWLPAWEHSPGSSAEPVPRSRHVGLLRPALREGMPAPRVGTGSAEEQQKCVDLGLGWDRWAACGSQPQAGHRGPIVAGPARPGPQERPSLWSFEKCLDRAAQALAWPS